MGAIVIINFIRLIGRGVLVFSREVGEFFVFVLNS